MFKVGDIVKWNQISLYKKDIVCKKILDSGKVPYTENDKDYIWERILTGQIIEVYDNRVTVTYIGSNGTIQKSNAHKRTILIKDLLDN